MFQKVFYIKHIKRFLKFYLKNYILRTTFSIFNGTVTLISLSTRSHTSQSHQFFKVAYEWHHQYSFHSKLNIKGLKKNIGSQILGLKQIYDT